MRKVVSTDPEARTSTGKRAALAARLQRIEGGFEFILPSTFPCQHSNKSFVQTRKPWMDGVPALRQVVDEIFKNRRWVLKPGIQVFGSLLDAIGCIWFWTMCQGVCLYLDALDCICLFNCTYNNMYLARRFWAWCPGTPKTRTSPRRRWSCWVRNKKLVFFACLTGASSHFNEVILIS